VERPSRDLETTDAPRARAATIARVLIVDDEPALAEAMGRQLGDRFDVQLAHEGHEALRALERTAFDVVLCDVRLPGLSGMQLFEAAIAARPALAGRFVFVTGNALDPALMDFVERHDLRVLDKPFSGADLDGAVLRALSGG
jgi:CheY-like chemotaxis protein